MDIARLIAIAAAGLLPVQAIACTLCDQPAATALRERLSHASPLGEFSVIILPIVVLGAIIACAAWGPSERPPHRDADA